MDARFVGERVGADDRLVGRDGQPRDRAHEATDANELSRVDPGMQTILGRAGGEGHHHLFERRVPGPLTQAVDRDLGLPRPGVDARERVGRGQAEVVVAMHRNNHAVDARDVGADATNERPELVGRGVPDRVWDVDRRGARSHRARDGLVQEIGVAATRIFWTELDVAAEASRVAHHVVDALEHVRARHAELVLHVEVGRGQKEVDPRAGGQLDGLPRAIDVAPVGTREPAHDRRVRRRSPLDRTATDALRDCPHRRKVVGRRRRKTSLDDVDPEPSEGAGDLELLGRRHRCARRLLAVAQRRVEDAYVTLRIGRHRRPPLASRILKTEARPSPGRGMASSRAASRRPARRANRAR